MTANPPDKAAFDFHMEEYRSLREEMLAAQAERRLIDRLGASAIVAIYAWLLTSGAKSAPLPLYMAAWLLPPVTALICLMLSTKITKGIRTAGVYVGLIEDRYADAALCGWHATLSHFRHHKVMPQPDPDTRDKLLRIVELDKLSKLSRRFWTSALIVTILIAVVIAAALSQGWLKLEG